jgi:hypothetical protein
MVTADNLASNDIDCRNLRYSGLRPRQAAALPVEDNIVIGVVAVVSVIERFEIGESGVQSSRDGICL